MSRKTVEVSKVLDAANTFLASTDSTPDGREAVCALLETVLFETGNYAGFRYLEAEFYESGELKSDGSGSKREYFD